MNKKLINMCALAVQKTCAQYGKEESSFLFGTLCYILHETYGPDFDGIGFLETCNGRPATKEEREKMTSMCALPPSVVSTEN